MKRLIIVASLAILAVGCQKTFVENEVLTPIGFNTEVGKQTRALVTTGKYPTDQPFGVYSYGYQDGENTPSSTPMPNVQVSRQAVPNTDPVAYTYKATTGTYYWPNNPETTLSFYAYSPYIGVGATATANDKKMTVTGFNHDVTTGFRFTGYTHADTGVDFMIATPVTGATFDDQNGDATDKNPKDASVPVDFNHMMTQVKFNVSTSYAGVNFAVKSITLKNVGNIGNFSEKETPAWAVTGTADYTVVANLTSDNVVTSNASYTSPGVTMLPQTIDANSLHSFEIKYEVSGDGVATETVTREVKLNTAPAYVSWAMNKCVTYNVTIGLKEINFEPTVAGWATPEVTGGEYTIFQ